MDSARHADWQIRENWYTRQFNSDMTWQIEFAKQHGLSALIERDTNYLSFKVGTPIVILPSMHRSDTFNFIVSDWEGHIDSKIIPIRREPLIVLCMCRFYNKRSCSVEIDRISPHPHVKMYGLQLRDCAIVTSNKTNVVIPEMGNLLFNRLNNRSHSAIDRIMRHGINPALYRETAFCTENHDSLELFKNYCRKCAGHISGSIPGVRGCECVMVGDLIIDEQDGYRADALLMEYPWEPFRLNRG